MITWGINANNHDASISVFYNNYLLYAGHSERYSKVKNDKDLDRSQVTKLIYEWGYPKQVFWFEKPLLKYLRNVYSGQSYKYFSPKEYLNSYGIDTPIEYVNHHEGHAASAFYTSGYNEAAVLVIDSIGEWNTVSIWKGSDKGLKKVYTVNYPSSIGLFYSAMTQRVGLKPNEEEYILMGMSGYGNPDTYYYDMKKDFFDGLKVKENLHKGCSWWKAGNPINEYDVAAATQLIFEEVLASLAHKAKQLTGSDNLAYAGGCALNCSANSLLFGIFKNVWIFPNPGDSGLSVGAVLAKTKNKMWWQHNFWGHDLDLPVNYKSVINSLKQGKIVAIASGNAEFGPRSLGNRSIIADPRTHEMKDKVNEIKRRQKFRPFAPAILQEYAHEYFEMPVDQSRFMQYAFNNKTDKLPATVHVDGTSRVQTVPMGDTHLRTILDMWYKETGCPALLNTSMNIKGQPIVNDAQDALDFMNRYNVSVNE